MDTKHFALLFLALAVLVTLGHSQTVEKMAVRGDIRFRFVTTEITCVMTNDKDVASELVFDVTLPKQAFITNFSMEIDGKDYPGDVKEKQKAREQYTEARRSGQTGGIVEQSARHSNKFHVSVNMAAGNNVTFTLLYQELLRRQFGSYEYSVYIDEDILKKVKDYSIEVFIQDRNEIKDVRTPAMRKEITSNSVEEGQNALTQISSPSATSVYMVYKPSMEELKRQGAGWFVVQYDVQSDSAGDLLVVDGYFVHFFVLPDSLPPMPLDIVFVLDISGSMSGSKIQQLREAMGHILGDLRETDRFNILLFDSSVTEWQPSLLEASESNVERAQAYVRSIRDRGATDLHRALIRGLELLQGSRESARVPVIFFLTDGEPTAGVQNSRKIVEQVSAKNEGVVNIYSLAFGAGADYKLLRQISAKNKGFARKIYEDSDAAQQVSGLYREISTIVLRNLTISYHNTSNNSDGDDNNGGPIVVEPTICVLPTMFGKSDFVVAGKLESVETMAAPQSAFGLKTMVSGLGAKSMINLVLEENDLTGLVLSGDNPYWAVSRDLSKMAERTWAFLTIKQLLEAKLEAQEDADLIKTLNERILELSLKYHFVTPLTSMVVTRPEDDLKTSESKAASLTDDDEVRASSPRQQMSSSHRISKTISQSMGFRQAAYLSPQAAGAAGIPAIPYGRQHSVPSFDYGNAPYLPEMALLPRPTISTTSLITRPRRKHSRGKKITKGTRKRKGGKKNKKSCNKVKKVILSAVTTSGQHSPVTCFSLKASRNEHNYTLISDSTANFSVTVGMKKVLMQALYVHTNKANYTITVNRDGDVIGAQQTGNHSADVVDGQYSVSVNMTRRLCKRAYMTIHLSVSDADSHADLLQGYTGLMAQAYQGMTTANMGKGGKKGKARQKKRKFKRKSSPGCLALQVPVDRSTVIKGKKLLMHKV